MIHEHDKNAILAAAKERIAEVIGDFVPLTRGKGCCPFHKEETASFSVKDGFYNCFGCGKRGDAVKFIRDLTGKSFPETLHYLADRLGISISSPPPELSAEEKMIAEERAAMLSVIAEAATFYHNILNSSTGEKARNYLMGRGVGAKEAVDYKLGYAPEGWTSLTEHLEGKTAIAEKAGLIKKGKKGYFDLMRGRVIFPIVTRKNEIIAFAARSLTDEPPKYINSPESPLYYKSDTIFGVNLALEDIRQHGSAIIVEGYMDHLNLRRIGVRNVVATGGTALTGMQIKRVIACGAKSIEIMFDGDKAGQEAIKKALPVIQAEGVAVVVRQLTGGIDPGVLTSISEMPAPISAEEYLFKETERGKEVFGRLGELEKIALAGDGERPAIPQTDTTKPLDTAITVRLEKLEGLLSIIQKAKETTSGALAIRMIWGEGDDPCNI